MNIGRISVALVVVSCMAVGAGPLARITLIEGNASVLKKGAEDWRPARPNMPLAVGDEIYARAESFVEVRYEIGAVVRLNEETKVVIESSDKSGVKSRSTLGDVWVNMKKLTVSGKRFDMASPTAVASIRGTSYRMTTGADSSTDVNVFNGTVAVGPSSDLKNKLEKQKIQAPVGEAVEVPGPEEIPGPFEVPLDQWQSIVAGQKISVHSDGKYAKEQFELENALGDLFVKKNQELDKSARESK